MSDDLDDLNDLKSAMRAATPSPDPARKAADLALAQKNFAQMQMRRQGSADTARQTSDVPKTGLFRGVANMFASLSTRGGLVATTAIVALGLVVVSPQVFNIPQDGLRDLIPLRSEKETAGSKPDADDAVVALGRRQDHAQGQLQEEAPLAEPALELTAPVAGAIAPNASSGYAAPSPVPQVSADHAAGALRQRLTKPGPAPKIAAQPGQMPEIGRPLPEADTEAFPEAEANPVKITTEEPVSTFSIDVDTASYAVVRSSLTAGNLPPKAAVRVEEMVNYFPYDYPAPEAGGAPFRPTVTVSPTPWNADTQLLHIAVQGQMPAQEDRPPLNLVFLIDTSGSMNHPDKLPLLRQSLKLMLSRLTAQDQVAIVAYAGSAGQVLEPTEATDRRAIMGALNKLDAGGSTAGQAGLQQAYAVAEAMTAEGEVTRVILATDGDFNVGLSDPDALKDYIADKRDSGTYLSVLGFGRGNLDDATMQALAQNGNGQAAYIDTLSEAQKVLVDQFTGALFPIADDVKIQVEFNPGRIAEYRLIGYETRALRREDFNNDRIDAGEIGAGHSVTALYEITPVGSPARLSDPLRYQAAAEGDPDGELGYLKLRYKAPGADTSQLIETPIAETGAVSTDMRFAMAIAGFGQLLTKSSYLGDWGWDQAIALASETKGDDPFGYRAEAVQLMRLAQSLSAQ